MGPKPTACYIRLGGFLVSEGDEQLKDGTAYSPLRPPEEARTRRKDRCAEAHKAPSHISKMVLPTVQLGPPNWTKSRTSIRRTQ